MRIVHIARYYGERNIGGAAIAATRLHRALVKGGVDSIFVCLENHSNETDRVIEFPPRGTIHRMIVVLLSKLSRNIWRCILERSPRSLNIIPTGINALLRRLQPDIVHFHWFTDEMASFAEIEKIEVPVVMHLHDMWMLCAFEPYPHGDRRYITGYDKSNSRPLEALFFARKRRLVTKKGISFIGPSKWVKRCADESLVAAGQRNFCVPYFQDETFRYRPDLRVHHDKFRILFGAYGGRSNPIKGFDDLRVAVESLPLEIQDKCELLVFGEKALPYSIGRVPVRFLGTANSADELLRIYHQADVFAFPSREETWGQTKSEALLCGLPVIAFDRTACAEGIIHGETGWVAADSDEEGFADGIRHFFNLYRDNALEESRTFISKRTALIFNNQTVLEKFQKVYAQLI